MEVYYYETGQGRIPVEEFIDGLDSKLRSKAFAYLHMLRIAGSELRMPHSRRLTRDLHELRPSVNGEEARIVYFLYKGAAIVVSGFVKKSRRTPRRELELARKRMVDYKNRRDDAV